MYRISILYDIFIYLTHIIATEFDMKFVLCSPGFDEILAWINYLICGTLMNWYLLYNYCGTPHKSEMGFLANNFNGLMKLLICLFKSGFFSRIDMASYGVVFFGSEFARRSLQLTVIYLPCHSLLYFLTYYARDTLPCVVTPTLLKINSTCMLLCYFNLSCFSTSRTWSEVFSTKMNNKSKSNMADSVCISCYLIHSFCEFMAMISFPCKNYQPLKY